MNLAEDDQQWLSDLVQRLMDGSEQRLSARFRQELQQLQQEMRHLEERITENIHDSETRLLTGFHKWASPAELRISSHSTALRALDLEMEALKERVKKLEGDAPQA